MLMLTQIITKGILLMLLFELALLFPTTFPLNWLRFLLLLLRLLLTLTTRVNMAQITAHTYSKFTSFCFTGGQNAFNYVSLVLAILTLVVNVNNNLNNNNNNLNQFSGNVVGNNNANANSNNNNGNVVNVMPPGKKRKRRKRSLKSNSNSTFCEDGRGEDRSLNSNLGNASMATMKLIQVYLFLVFTTYRYLSLAPTFWQNYYRVSHNEMVEIKWL